MSYLLYLALKLYLFVCGLGISVYTMVAIRQTPREEAGPIAYVMFGLFLLYGLYLLYFSITL